jgi:hypothetical protein
MRRIAVPGQSEQTKLMRPQLRGKKLGMVLHSCCPTYNRKLKIGDGSPGQASNHKILAPNYPEQKGLEVRLKW